MALPVRHSTSQPTRSEAAQALPNRLDPFYELERLHRQMAEFLDSWGSLPSLWSDGFKPSADVEETDDAYTVEIELPGVNRNDLEIEVSGRRLSVHGERKEKERIGIVRRRGRTVGRFDYEVTLPGDVDEEAIEAHLSEECSRSGCRSPSMSAPGAFKSAERERGGGHYILDRRLQLGAQATVK
jgi:HSP20 family protein